MSTWIVEIIGAPNAYVQQCEVLEMRPSKSLPNQGLIKLRTTTLNQNNQAVQVQIGNSYHAASLAKQDRRSAATRDPRGDWHLVVLD